MTSVPSSTAELGRATAEALGQLPVQRVSPRLLAASNLRFGSLLRQTGGAAAPQTTLPTAAPLLPVVSRTNPFSSTPPVGLLPAHAEASRSAGLPGISRDQILANAEQNMGIPYVWGGNASGGLDCSAFVSRVWGVPRQTTETIHNVAYKISKDELQAGDALNLTMSQDASGAGHIRLFDRWANPEHTKMWVYEETPPRSVHHVINWDNRYQPYRRFDVADSANQV